MVGNAERDGWRGPQRFVNAAEIIMGDIEGDGRNAIVDRTWAGTAEMFRVLVEAQGGGRFCNRSARMLF